MYVQQLLTRGYIELEAKEIVLSFSFLIHLHFLSETRLNKRLTSGSTHYNRRFPNMRKVINHYVPSCYTSINENNIDSSTHKNELVHASQEKIESMIGIIRSNNHLINHMYSDHPISTYLGNKASKRSEKTITQERQEQIDQS